MKYKMLGLLVAALVALASQTAHASLILRLTGTAGSNVISYEASGSVTVTENYTGLNSSLGLAPVAGNWTGGFDQNLGDFLSNSMDTGSNDDLALSNGGVSYRKNGVEFGVLELLDLDGSTSSGGDDVELDTAGNIDYSDLVVGDIVSWTGSGTFTLEDSETFDTLFTATGTFSATIDGGTYDVIIAESSAPPIPEPGSILIFAGLGGCLFMRRRAKKKA